MYNESLAKIAAFFVFIGFNVTFLPQFILGTRGMPRRYYNYPPEFQVLNVCPRRAPRSWASAISCRSSTSSGR